MKKTRRDKTRQDETEVHNDGQSDKVNEEKVNEDKVDEDKVDEDKVNEDKVDSLNDFGDENDDENIEDKDNLEGFIEDNIDNYGDIEEDQEPGKDMKPEPPPQPPLYRPSRPPIKLSFLGTTSFKLRTRITRTRRIHGIRLALWEDGSVFRNQDLKKIRELKCHDYCYLKQEKEEESKKN